MIGQVVFGLLISDSVTLLLVITAVLLCVGAVAGLLLPFETAGKILDDAEDQEEGGTKDSDTPGVLRGRNEGEKTGLLTLAH
jgi:hypothetical protein